MKARQPGPQKVILWLPSGPPVGLAAVSLGAPPLCVSISQSLSVGRAPVMQGSLSMAQLLLHNKPSQTLALKLMQPVLASLWIRLAGLGRAALPHLAASVWTTPVAACGCEPHQLECPGGLHLQGLPAGLWLRLAWPCWQHWRGMCRSVCEALPG